MTQTTTIKTTKDGRELSYRDGTLYLAGMMEGSGAIQMLTATQRKGLASEYIYRSGRVVLTQAEAEILRAAVAQHETQMAAERNNPECVERARIDALYGRADRVQYEDTDLHFRLRHEADAALAAWRATHVQAARAERQQLLRDKAAHERSLALGALTYDADGWLSREDQQRRHDEYMAQAAQYDAQAEGT